MTKQQLENFAAVELMIRHTRNCCQLGPHPLRAEAVMANTALQDALGKDYSKIFKTKTWTKRSAL